MIMTLVCALLAISSAHPGPQATQSVKLLVSASTYPLHPSHIHMHGTHSSLVGGEGGKKILNSPSGEI